MLKKIGYSNQISSNPKEIESAEKLILPGVGSFDKGMENLHHLNLVEALNNAVLKKKTPILGICLGMQLFCKNSEEGVLPGLGWVSAEVVRFNFKDLKTNTVKIPHMGWAEVEIKKTECLFRSSDHDLRFYFVHSYYLVNQNLADISATCYYNKEFTAAIEYGNIMGVQFHPEKSHKFGMSLLKNFASKI